MKKGEQLVREPSHDVKKRAEGEILLEGGARGKKGRE